MKKTLFGVLIVVLINACTSGTGNKTKSMTENTVESESYNLPVANPPDSVIEIREINNYKVLVYTPSDDNPNVSEQGVIVYDQDGNQVSEMKYVKSSGNEWSIQSSNYEFTDNVIEVSFESNAFQPGVEAGDDPSIGVTMEEFLMLDDPYLILDKEVLKKWTDRYEIDEAGMIEKTSTKVNDYKQEVTELSRLDILPPDRLRILRNSIFAKHGYRFSSEDLQDYFSQKTWYKAERRNVDDLLTETDKEIISYLKQREEIAGNKQ
ncbi:MAG: YARHG domain-containing protein [Bacteroidota bacterium]